MPQNNNQLVVSAKNANSTQTQNLDGGIPTNDITNKIFSVIETIGEHTAQLKSIDNSIKSLETQFRDTKSDVNNRINTLDSTLTQKINNLDKRLTDNITELRTDNKKLGDQLTNDNKDLSKQISTNNKWAISIFVTIIIAVIKLIIG